MIIFSGCAGRKGFAVPGVGKAEDGGCVPRSGSVRAVRTKLRWTAGTIFQDTRTPLKVWFHALWWMTSQKNGVSALGLQRVLGLGSYQTAWCWLHKLRRAMVRAGRDRLSGTVEVDEAYVGLRKRVCGAAKRKARH